MHAPTFSRRPSSAERKVLRRFIALRRRQEAAARAVDSLEPTGMGIVRDCGPLEADGATLALEQFFRWTYSTGASGCASFYRSMRTEGPSHA